MSVASAPPRVEARRIRPIVWWFGAVAVVQAIVVVINLSPLADSYTLGSLFDLNGEGNVTSWFSASLLLVVAGGFGVIAFVERERGTDWRGWAFIAAGFVLLSVDEAASVHELAGELASKIATVSWLPSLYLWVVVVAPIAAVIAVITARWVVGNLSMSDPAARLFVLAVGVWLTVPIFEAVDPVLGGPTVLVAIEETLEVAGEAMMVAAVAFRLQALGVVEALTQRTMART